MGGNNFAALINRYKCMPGQWLFTGLYPQPITLTDFMKFCRLYS